MFIIKRKFLFVSISIVLVVLSILALIIFKLPFGIDFKGGSVMQIKASTDITSEMITSEIAALKLTPNVDPKIQSVADGYIIKTRNLSESEHFKVQDTLTKNLKSEEKSYNAIGPSVGNELKTKSVLSIILVSLAIILFIAYAFRKVSKPVESWKYGLVAIVTLLHDVIIPVGVFAILARSFGVEVDTLFVVAILTVLGLSVSDTIVVFDRIRENIAHHTGKNFAETVGISLSETYARSIATSLTVIIALLSLVLFGPVSTKYFALMLMAGMFFGTYSSIFLASPLLVIWQEYNDKKKKR